jgi:hypothetical protein
MPIWRESAVLETMVGRTYGTRCRGYCCGAHFTISRGVDNKVLRWFGENHSNTKSPARRVFSLEFGLIANSWICPLLDHKAFQAMPLKSAI